MLLISPTKLYTSIIICFLRNIVEQKAVKLPGSSTLIEIFGHSIKPTDKPDKKKTSSWQNDKE